MSLRVADLLQTFTPRPLFNEYSSTLSSKPWTDTFAPILPDDISIHAPTYQSIDAMLGLGDPSADTVGLQNRVHPLNNRPQMIVSEGDVTADFNQNIIPGVEMAFFCSDPSRVGCPTLWSQSMRKADSNSSDSSTRIVDYQMIMSHQERSLEGPVMIGEMKRPGVIIGSEWRGETRPRSKTLRLGKELRAYAFQYECTQVFAFDMNNALILRFRASDRDHLKEPSCEVDCCVIPREPDPYTENPCTIQYGLYRLAAEGWMRRSATLDVHRTDNGPIPRSLDLDIIDGYERHYSWYSGRPKWIDAAGRLFRHHPRLRRVFRITHTEDRRGMTLMIGYWVWVDQGRTIANDTGNCFITTRPLG